MVRGLFLKLGLAAALGVLLFADTSKAQTWGWGRGYGGWGYYGPGWYGSYGTYPNAYGAFAYPGGNWPSYYGYYGGWPYYSYGYNPWTGSLNSYYGTTYAPQYESGVIGSTRTYGYARETANESGNYGTTTSFPSTAALISVIVPPEAEIWFDNYKTKQTGTERRFLTPSLDPNRNFFYEVHARWMENNRPVEKTEVVRFHAGEQPTVDFTVGAVQSADQPVP
jgi:uncharacterized protein (TIGR03000 family)